MTIRILAVCTGNICRSPMAEALLRAGAAEVGLDAQITSVGSWESGVAADPHAISVMSIVALTSRVTCRTRPQ